jgi:hypothetical protein
VIITSMAGPPKVNRPRGERPTGALTLVRFPLVVQLLDRASQDYLRACTFPSFLSYPQPKPPATETRRYEQVGDGYKLTVSGTRDGKPYSWSYTAQYDGKSEVRVEFKKALALRSQIWRAGWFT